MDLVIDANIFISALIANQGKTFDLIFNDRLKLFAPEFLLDETEKYKSFIIQKSRLTHEEFNVFMSLICSRIQIYLKNDFKIKIKEAEKISPDANDTEYFALALRLNCGIWSNDKILKNQEFVKVYSTIDLLNNL